MACYGRDRWRDHAEVFSVWFGLLGRLAPYGLEGPAESGPAAAPRLRERPRRSPLVDVAAGRRGHRRRARSSGTASRRRSPSPTSWAGLACSGDTLLLGAFLAGLVWLVAARGAARRPAGHGSRPGPGGRRLPRRALPGLPARRGPAHRGGAVRPAAAGLGPAGDRRLGAARRLADRPRRCGPSRSPRSCSATWSAPGSATARCGVSASAGEQVSQWPLAALMIGLTVLALWSLGQNLVFVSAMSRGHIPRWRRPDERAEERSGSPRAVTSRPSTALVRSPSRSMPA